MMLGTSLYSAVLGLSSKWRISNASLDESSGCVEIRIGPSSDAEFSCPICNGRTNKVGASEHSWLHDAFLNTKLRIVARMPLISCETCGIKRVEAPWERPGSNFREGSVDKE